MKKENFNIIFLSNDLNKWVAQPCDHLYLIHAVK